MAAMSSVKATVTSRYRASSARSNLTRWQDTSELINAMLSHAPEDRPATYEVGKALI